MIRIPSLSRASLLAGAALAALSGTSAHAAVDRYEIEGESQVTINLEICSAESQLAVRGESGTDLDFNVTNGAGETVHQDTGIDDYLSVVIAKQGEACETFALAVNNLGEDDNSFTVVLEPVIASSTRVQKYIIQANETQTVTFKACGTSALVSARGDGDTDLDFVIRNSDGAVVHENADESDVTSAQLEGLLSDCEEFEIDIANLGEVYNAVMLVVEPEGVADMAYEGTQPSTSLADVSFASGVIRSSSTAESSGEGEYRADANALLKVNLPVCGATRLEVRGDGDTDLDFTVKDAAGDVVHSDDDLSDVTFTTLSPSEECETFGLEVSNLGEVFNVFTVALIDPATRAASLGPGEYRVNANGATKVALRVCAVTKVRARGEGETDLDFDVTDAGGGSVHSNYDLTDATEFTLDPGSGCADYQLAVSNIGDANNMLTVDFGGESAPAMRPGAGGIPSGVKSDIAPPGSVVGRMATGGSPDGEDRRIAIVNETGEDVSALFWSNSATLDWGDDRLSSYYALSRGQQWTVDVFDGSSACLFDFRAVTQSDRSVEVTGVNVCEATSVVIE